LLSLLRDVINLSQAVKGMSLAFLLLTLILLGSAANLGAEAQMPNTIREFYYMSASSIGLTLPLLDIATYNQSGDVVLLLSSGGRLSRILVGDALLEVDEVLQLNQSGELLQIASLSYKGYMIEERLKYQSSEVVIRTATLYGLKSFVHVVCSRKPFRLILNLTGAQPSDVELVNGSIMVKLGARTLVLHPSSGALTELTKNDVFTATYTPGESGCVILLISVDPEDLGRLAASWPSRLSETEEAFRYIASLLPSLRSWHGAAESLFIYSEYFKINMPPEAWSKLFAEWSLYTFYYAYLLQFSKMGLRINLPTPGNASTCLDEALVALANGLILGDISTGIVLNLAEKCLQTPDRDPLGVAAFLNVVKLKKARTEDPLILSRLEVLEESALEVLEVSLKSADSTAKDLLRAALCLLVGGESCTFKFLPAELSGEELQSLWVCIAAAYEIRTGLASHTLATVYSKLDLLALVPPCFDFAIVDGVFGIDLCSSPTLLVLDPRAPLLLNGSSLRVYFRGIPIEIAVYGFGRELDRVVVGGATLLYSAIPADMLQPGSKIYIYMKTPRFTLLKVSVRSDGNPLPGCLVEVSAGDWATESVTGSQGSAYIQIPAVGAVRLTISRCVAQPFTLVAPLGSSDQNEIVIDIPGAASRKPVEDRIRELEAQLDELRRTVLKLNTSIQEVVLQQQQVLQYYAEEVVAVRRESAQIVGVVAFTAVVFSVVLSAVLLKVGGRRW